MIRDLMIRDLMIWSVRYMRELRQQVKFLEMELKHLKDKVEEEEEEEEAAET